MRNIEVEQRFNDYVQSSIVISEKSSIMKTQQDQLRQSKNIEYSQNPSLPPHKVMKNQLILSNERVEMNQNI